MASALYKLSRYKFQKLPVGETKLLFYSHRNGETKVIAEKTVSVSNQVCSADKYKYIKYLSSDGTYKFIAFTKVWTVSEENEQIGEVSKIVTSLETTQSYNESIGAKTKKIINCSVQCSKEQYFEYIKCLESPRVYLQKDTTELEDEDKNWLLVKISGTPNLTSKKSASNFAVTIELPDYNNITMV